MNPITITIESKPTTINFDGRELQVQKLSIPLPFGRKPTDISDIAACGVEAVYVTEIREMDPEEFDGFKLNLGKSRDWRDGARTWSPLLVHRSIRRRQRSLPRASGLISHK
jgi:hypothetical protein